MHCTSNLLGRKKKKMTQQLKGEKYEYTSSNWALGLPPLQVLEGTNKLKAFTMPFFGFQSFKKQLSSFLKSHVGAFVQSPLPISKVVKIPFKQSAPQLSHHKHQA